MVTSTTSSAVVEPRRGAAPLSVCRRRWVETAPSPGLRDQPPDCDDGDGNDDVCHPTRAVDGDLIGDQVEGQDDVE